MISDILKGVKTWGEALIKLEGLSPDFGPYSHSRLDHGCDEQFYKKHVLREEGTPITRFGTNVGSATHDVAEVDVQLRIREIDKDVVEVVDHVLSKNPDYDEHRASLENWIGMMRSAFEINRPDYVASELEVGVDLNMNAVPYDSDKAWFRGKIDYLEVSKDGIARVVDFKTYPSIHSDASLNDTSSGVGSQLMGYLAMCMAYNPAITHGYYEVYYFRFGTSRTSSFKDDDGLWKRLYFSRKDVMNWWGMNQRRMIGMERKTEFLPKPSQKACQYCPFLSECSVKIDFEKDFIARTVDEAKQLSNALVVLDERQARLKHATKAFLESHQEDKIHINGDKFIGAASQVLTSIDVKAFLSYCDNNDIDPIPYLNVTKSKYEKFVRDYEEIEGARNERIRTTTKTH